MNVDFERIISVNKVSLHEIFPTLGFSSIVIPDMSSGGDFFGTDSQHENLKFAAQCLRKFQQKHSNSLLANGYLEERSFYNTERFERISDTRIEYRNIHLGTDFWIPTNTPVHAPYDGTIVISHHNDFHKDYGPLLVLEHKISGAVFYTLYGHLTTVSLTLSPKGKQVAKGDLIAHIGNEDENGHWLPHLHFQVITNLLNETENYKGVAFPSEIEHWKKLCPDPNLMFIESLH